MSRKRRRFWFRTFEFLIIGVVFGVVEDFLAVRLAGDADSAWEILKTVFWVAVPFAIFSELIVDQPEFWRKLFRLKDNKED